MKQKRNSAKSFLFLSGGKRERGRENWDLNTMPTHTMFFLIQQQQQRADNKLSFKLHLH